MITTINLHDFKAELAEGVLEQELDCSECEGEGVCPCCDRECRECDGTGTRLKKMTDREVHALYFTEVMNCLRKLCAFSSRHDFLTEAGDFIKANGRPDERNEWLKLHGLSEASYIRQPHINTMH